MYKNRFCLLLMLMLLFSCIQMQKSETEIKLIPFEDEKSGWGYKDEEGNILIRPQFHIAFAFSPEGIAAVADDNGWIYIDKTGKQLITPFIFDNGPDYFQEGLARFTANNKIGFFDKKGKIIIEAKFDFAFPFHEGLAVICMGCKEVPYDEEHRIVTGGKWGYINKKGNIVIPLKFQNASHFENGKATVMFNGQTIYIDKEENIIR